jgi:hypothetical protein
VLSGFDRLVFRGTLIPLVMDGGMYTFLKRSGVRLLDFKSFVQRTSERVKSAALREANKHERPVRYLESGGVDKEAFARQLLKEHPVDRGLICALTTVEPCRSFEYHRSQDRRERGLKLRTRKCLHIYKYLLHPVFGFMSARIQTWFPFNIQVCLNGREWLGRQLARKRRTDFKRYDNCFTWLGNPELAQRLMDQQLETDWAHELTAIARRLNPLHTEIFKPWPQDYYWSAYQSEWATDVLFENPKALASVYPALVEHATLHFASADVMRFLGRKGTHGNFTGELVSSFKHRPEGMRVKHWAHGNSIKMYDKAGSVLRIETTIAKTTDFKSFRPLQNDPKGKLAWRPLRKGIADLHRRAEVSQRSNETYLEALAAVDDDTPLATLFDQVCEPATYHGRRVRALRIGQAEDVELLKAISHGEFTTAGFRNRDLRHLLYPNGRHVTKEQERRLSAKVGRQLRLLRAHGLILKVQKSHLYRLTDKGRLLAAALFAARTASIKQLVGRAA